MAEKKSLQQHAAEFILRHCRGNAYRNYRKQCLDHWRRVYGEVFASEVEKIIHKEWKK